MPRIFLTASFRFAALYVLLFAGSAVILAAVVYWTTGAALERQLSVRIAGEMTHLTEVYDTGGLTRLEHAVRERSVGLGALDYVVQTPDGRRLSGEIPSVGARRGWLRLTAEEDRSGEPKQVRVLVRQLPGGIVIGVGDGLRGIHEAEEAVLLAFAWAVGATAVLGVLGGAWLSHLFLRRVDAIARTAEAIISGDLRQRIPVRNTNDDLDRLAGTLNRMLDRIGVLLENLHQTSNNIAHDLRTPLSHLAQRLEDARAHARSMAEYERALDGARAEVAALLATFASMLRIAEVEAGAQRAAFRVLDLSLIAKTVAEVFAPDAEDLNHRLDSDITAGLEVHGDHELLTQMLANLVENALGHTPPGARIELALRREAGRAVLSVEDNGPGIPEPERERVLQRFYRLEKSRTTPGSGLGLSLVAAIAELHEADLQLQDAAPGLRVRVVFPPVQRDRKAGMRTMDAATTGG